MESPPDCSTVSVTRPGVWGATHTYLRGSVLSRLPESAVTEYAASLFAALKPGGTLIALAFPVEEREGGPPFGIDEGEIEAVLGRGLELVHFETPTNSVEPRLGRERLALFRKPS